MSKVKKRRPLILFFDVETNGLPERKHGFDSYYEPSDTEKYDSSRLIAIAWAVYSFKGKKKLERNYLVKNENVSIKNTFIHGITEKMINKDGISIINIFNQFNKDLKGVKVVAAHNFKFDKHIFLSEMYRYKHRQDFKKLIQKFNNLEHCCIGEKAKNAVKIPFKSSYVISKYKMPTLPELYTFCFKKKMLNHHKPKFDVQHMAECFFHLLKN
jgi:DNA polymerase III epsilon subunit-like protein